MAHAKKRLRTALAAVMVLLATVACSATTTSRLATPTSTAPPPTIPPPTVPASTVPCIPPAGGRCAGPVPVARWLVGSLALGPAGRRISGRFQCGGRLTAQEASDRVILTFIASSAGAGAMSCALVPLSVDLRSPLDDRTLVDGVSHQALPAPVPSP